MNWIFLQTSRGSFSAVSTPMFASKYSLESSWRDLYILLHRSDLKISAKNRQHFFRMNNEFPICFVFCVKFWIFPPNFWWIFFRISRQIPENSDVCRFFNQICENKSEICRKFWILWKLFTIFQNYSLVSLIAVHGTTDTGRREADRWVGDPPGWT